MIEIIKAGNRPEDTQYKTTCYNCKTLFSYQRSDLHSNPKDGDYVECPLCSAFVDHSLKVTVNHQENKTSR